jgi:3-hydroxyisobutyrate dehydrogenase
MPGRARRALDNERTTVARIGFAGLGKMGAVMAPRFIDAGYELWVWNRTPGRTEPLLAAGARVAATPAALAAESEVLISMLTDDAAVLAVYDGPQGFLRTPSQGRLYIDMSTLRPSTVRDLAARVYAAGAGFVDAPVSGTVAPAQAGRLLALAGGTDEDLTRARPVLEVLTRRIVHAGPAGSGALLKLVVNLPLAVYWASLAEAFALGKAGGLEPALMLDTILDSSAALAVLPLKAPSILADSDHVAFDVASMQKDMLAMLETGSSEGVPMAVSAAALAGYSALSASGLGAADAVAIVRFLIERMSRRPQGQ